MKKTNVTVMSALAGFTLLMCGCAEGTKNAVSNVAKAAESQGTWGSKCRSSDIFDVSMKEYQQLSGEDTKLIREYYTEDGCVEPAIRVTYEGKFLVGNEVAGLPKETRDIDLAYKKVLVLPITEAGKNLLETLNLCGQNKWAVGEHQDLTDKSGEALCALNDTPYALFDIFRVENDQLTLGKVEGDKNKLLSTARPDQLDPDLLYTKVDVTF